MAIANELYLNINKQTEYIKIFIPQGDNIDRDFLINFLDDDDSYVIPSTAIVRFAMTKKNGQAIYNNCRVSNNKALLEITPAISAEEGRHPASFRITDSATGGLLKTFRFHIIIQESPDIESIVTNSSEFTALQDMELRIGDTDEILTLAEEATENAIEAANLANAATANTNTATANAISAANNANDKANLAEIATSNADAKASLAEEAAVNANNKADLANTNAVNANTATTNANTAANNATTIANQLATETLKIFKDAVPTYSDLTTMYPSPEIGWTVTVIDENISYRFNGVSWINLGYIAIVKVATDLTTGVVKGNGNVSIKPDGAMWADPYKDKSPQLTGTSLTFTDADNSAIDLQIAGKSVQSSGTPFPAAPIPITSLGDSGSFVVRSENFDNSKSNEITINSVGYSLPDGTKDVINLTTGKKTQNVLKVVFDGSSDETWTKAQIGTGSRYRFYTTMTGKNISALANSLRCDKLNPIAFNLSSVPTEPSISGHNTVSTINVYGTMFDAMTVAEFKTWLSSNVVTVLCQCAAPVVSDIVVPQLPISYKGVTNVTSTDSVQPILTGIAKSETWSRDYSLNTRKINIGDDYRPNLSNNGDFQLWNRGSIFTENTKETADDWYIVNYQSSTTTSVGTMEKDTYGCKLSGAGINQLYIRQYLSNINYSCIEGKPITLSIYLKATTYNSGRVFIQLNFLDSNRSSLGIINNLYSKDDISSEFKRFSLNGIIPIGCKTIEIAIGSYSGYEGGIINSTCTLYIKNVKLEQNDHATPFIPKSNNEELVNISDGIGYKPNLLINGGFRLWNSGEVFNQPNGTPTADKWLIYNAIDASVKVLRQGDALRIEEYGWVGNTDALSDVIQLVDDYSKYRGSVLTMSGNISLDSGVTAKLYIGDGVSSYSSDLISASGTYKLTANISSSATYVNAMIRFYRSGIAIGKGLVVNWAKLEKNEFASPFIPLNRNLDSLSSTGGYTPNILINGDFSINQRGLTTYNAYGYTVDRWRFGGALITGQSVEKTSSGIKITASGTDAYIEQYCEDANKYLNKTLTLSVCDSWDNIYYASGVLTTSATGAVISIKSAGVEIGYVYFDYATWAVDMFRVVIIANPGKVLNIKWVKLEQSDHPTPFIPRLREEELALCQQYYEVSESWISSFCPSSTAISGFLFKVRKRINPTVIAISQYGTINNANIWAGSDKALTGAITSPYGVQYFTTNGAVKGEQYVYSFVADAEI
jgi:hypothetical protein